MIFFYLIILGCCGIVLYYSIKELLRKKYSIRCNLDILCKKIVWWGINNIPPHTDNNRITIFFFDKDKSESKKKVTFATYTPQLKRIEIFLGHNDNVYELVDSILHEVTHYKQHRTNPRKMIKDYKTLLNLYGYKKHPMELEANETAKRLQKECLFYLESNGFISTHQYF